jgi:Zn-finger nucleic acid-binding protein
MRDIACPQCSVQMQPFFAEAGDGGLKVELDRCPKCERLWFDVRELERAVGKSFLPRLKGADAERSCPVCKLLLGTSLISGDVAVEECGQCGGALLDAHDFQMISGKPLREAKAPPPPPPPKPKPPPPAAKKPKVVEFTCERCRTKTPISEAGNVNGATVCRKCETKPWPNQPTWYSSAGRGDDPLTELLDDIVDNLFNR